PAPLLPERIAGVGVAGVEAGPEPLLALGGGAVGEALRHHIALRLLLQRVVADRAGGIERLFDVARFEHLTLRVGMMRPDTGETVGLQFDLHRDGVGLRLRQGLLALVGIAEDADRVLHVMADLVCDDIGLREIAGGVVPPRQRIEEAEIEIDPPVGRAIERPDLRIGEAAAGLDAAGEKHELRLRIIAAVGGEQRIPDILGVGQHDGDEIGRIVLALRERLVALGGRLVAAEAVGEEAEYHDHDDDQEQPADAATPAAETGQPATAAQPAGQPEAAATAAAAQTAEPTQAAEPAAAA